MPRPVTSSVLVGRRDEVALIGELLDSLASDGTGGVLLVAGEAGVGKTRLVEVLGELVDDREVRLLVGRCVPYGEAVLPAAPLVDILGELVATMDAADLDAVIGTARTDLAALVPALALGSSGGEPLTPRRLFELVHGVLVRLAERGPVVVVVEDLHWADRTTRDLFGFLASGLAGHAALVVGTYRSDDLHRRHPLLPALAELQRAVRPQRLDVEPFDAETTADLIAAIGGHDHDRDAAEAMHRRSGGNAFYLEELLAAPDLDSPVTVTLRDVVLSRSLELDDDALSILRVASAVGSRIDEQLLALVADLDRSRINAALHQLVDSHFLVSGGGHFHFRHDLTREVFADELLPGERADLHACIAETLQEHEPQRLGEIAHHWYESGKQAEALRAATVAGEAASRSGATAEALVHFEHALELWDRVPADDRRTELGHADLLFLAADAADLSQEFHRSVVLARHACDELASGDNLTRALGLVQLRRFLWNSGEPGIDEAVELAVELVESEPASAAVASVLSEAGGNAMMANNWEESIRWCDRALEMALATGDRKTEAHTLNTLAMCRHMMGVPGAIEEMREATRLAVEIADGDEINRGYINLSELLVVTGRFEDAVTSAREGLVEEGRYGKQGSCAAMLVENEMRGLAALGRWEELDESTEEVLALRQLDLDIAAPTGLSALAGVMVKRGETDRARPLLEHDFTALASGVYCGIESEVVCGLLELATIEGQSAPDRALIESAIGLLSHKQDRRLLDVMASALRGEADSAISGGYLGDDGAVAEARAAAERWIGLVEQRNAERHDSPVEPDFDVVVAQCRAEYARAQGPSDPELWAAAVDGYDQLERPWQGAYVKWRYAESILLTAGQPSNGRSEVADLLCAAHAVAGDLGAKPLVADIEDLAARARIDLAVDRGDLAATEAEILDEVPFGLTPREQDVLGLVAEGFSNGRIGKELFISTKTASVHVSNILRKLGATNRIEAAAVANKVGITRTSEDDQPAGATP